MSITIRVRYIRVAMVTYIPCLQNTSSNGKSFTRKIIFIFILYRSRIEYVPKHCLKIHFARRIYIVIEKGGYSSGLKILKSTRSRSTGSVNNFCSGFRALDIQSQPKLVRLLHPRIYRENRIFAYIYYIQSSIKYCDFAPFLIILHSPSNIVILGHF